MARSQKLSVGPSLTNARRARTSYGEERAKRPQATAILEVICSDEG